LYRLPASFDSLHSEAILRPALASLKAHNVNTIILSGYPTGPEVYQLCDELGLYVVQKIDMLRPDELQKLTLDQRAEEGRKERTKLRAAALHLEEHPSVIAIYLDKNYSTSLADKLVLQEVNGLVSITAYKDRLVFMQRAYELTLPFDLYRVPDWNTLNLQQRADLKKQYQYAEFMVKGASENNLYLTNEHDFVGLEEWELRWQITGNGKTVQEGRIADLQVLPKKTLQITLPFSFQSYQDREGCVFRFTLDRKTGNAWAKPRDESAWEEFKLVRSPQGLLLLRSDDWSAAAKY
jgi:hypothetical protein